MATWTPEHTTQLWVELKKVSGRIDSSFYDFISTLEGQKPLNGFPHCACFSRWDYIDLSAFRRLPIRCEFLELLGSILRTETNLEPIVFFHDVPWQVFLSWSWVRFLQLDVARGVQNASVRPTNSWPNYHEMTTLMNEFYASPDGLDTLASQIAVYLHKHPQSLALWTAAGPWKQFFIMQRLGGSDRLSYAFMLTQAAVQFEMRRVNSGVILGDAQFLHLRNQLMNSTSAFVVIWNRVSHNLIARFRISLDKSLEPADKIGIIYVVSNLFLENDTGRHFFWSLAWFWSKFSY